MEIIATDSVGNTSTEDCGTFTVAPGGRPRTIGSARIWLFQGNRLSLFNNMSKKERNTRGADDLEGALTEIRDSLRAR
mgnify:CR=1 FL=1